MRLKKVSKTVLGSTLVVTQLSFSTFPTILTFDIYYILGLFLFFLALMCYFFGLDTFRKIFWGLIIKLLFSLLPSIITFIFDQILGSFGAYLGSKWADLGVKIRLFLGLLL